MALWNTQKAAKKLKQDHLLLFFSCLINDLRQHSFSCSGNIGLICYMSSHTEDNIILCTSCRLVSSCPLRGLTLCPDTAGGLQATFRVSCVSSRSHSPPRTWTHDKITRFSLLLHNTVKRVVTHSSCTSWAEDQNTHRHAHTIPANNALDIKSRPSAVIQN